MWIKTCRFFTKNISIQQVTINIQCRILIHNNDDKFVIRNLHRRFGSSNSSHWHLVDRAKQIFRKWCKARSYWLKIPTKNITTCVEHELITWILIIKSKLISYDVAGTCIHEETPALLTLMFYLKTNCWVVGNIRQPSTKRYDNIKFVD